LFFRKGSERRLTVTKTVVFVRNKVSKLNILPHTVERTTQLLQEFPLTKEELQDVLPLQKQIANIAAGKLLTQHLYCKFQK
jgi:hypothetical protein